MSTPNPQTTEWVPLWDLQGGVALEYRGAWAAGSYRDGDIVVDNGIAYMCVRQTSQRPIPWAQPPLGPSYGTAFPANPINGQEHILTDAVNPTFVWRFRYDANSPSAYKWYFIGGAPKVLSKQPGAFNAAVNTWKEIIDPDFICPRPGAYLFELQAAVAAGYSNHHLNVCNASVAGGVPLVGTSMFIHTQPSEYRLIAYDCVALLPTAGATARMCVYDEGIAATWYNRVMSVTPVQVS